MVKPVFISKVRRLIYGFVVTIFLLCLSPAQSASAITLSSALDRYNVGDFRSAIEQWEQLARMGNPDALFNLGQVYRMGNGVDMDMAKVEYFYRRAAQGGHIEAQNNLATLYFYDEVNTTRKGEALTWWRLAARNGHGQSQYMLAVLHYNGEFLPKDNIQAFAWVVLAKEAGVEAAEAAERVMRRTLTENEMAQGRLLSKGLTETPIGQSSYNVNIENPMGLMPDFPKGSGLEPPLVVDSPQEPPAPPSATIASRQPPSPSAPPSPSTPQISQQVVQPIADVDGRFQGWSLQMGSFRSIDNPNTLASRLNQEQAQLMQGLQAQVAVADLGDRGIYYRLLIGVFQNKAAALAHCQKFKDVGYDCIAVAP